ncbi:hypothetical protein IQ266_14010 [filamentous cyanobacterium LEGE 11480]|uniref:Uncharacterized protein n=1 Tax=Romeriopsis navalis LEGE 11480 TaxID=2777977 RepID=A0A928VLN9_9CYAN|nr:hypothetical protein [Romeriopsis navalis LEGE 11480]
MSSKSGWQSYELDRIAQGLVLDARERDAKSLNQSYKMRMAVSYGLERFWGEHLRLNGKEQDKADFWKATWDELVEVMKKAGVKIPNARVSIDDVGQIKAMSKQLWELNVADQRVTLAVLTQLCDCIVWWTQRYKVGRDNDDN